MAGLVPAIDVLVAGNRMWCLSRQPITVPTRTVIYAHAKYLIADSVSLYYRVVLQFRHALATTTV